jgi:hypothetical protein
MYCLREMELSTRFGILARRVNAVAVFARVDVMQTEAVENFGSVAAGNGVEQILS